MQLFFDGMGNGQGKTKGTVKQFNDAKGYGFVIAENNDSNDIFVHYTSILGDGFKTLSEGQKITFDLEMNEKNLLSAKNIEKETQE